MDTRFGLVVTRWSRST